VCVEFSILADAINLIDEDNCGPVSRGELEEPPHALGTDTHEHFGKVAAMRAEELRLGFAGNGFRQHGLSCSGRAYEEHPFGKRATQSLKPPGVAQKVDDLLNFAFGFLDAGHFTKGYVRALRYLGTFAASQIELEVHQACHQANYEEGGKKAAPLAAQALANRP